MLVECQNCRGQISDAALKCPKCAAAPDDFLGRTTKCRECGADYRLAYPACASCGAIRSVAAPEQALAATLSATTEPNRTAEPALVLPAIKERKKASGTAYVTTFIIAGIVGNGIAGVVGNLWAQDKSFQELASAEGQFQAAALDALVEAIVLVTVYGVSRSITRLVPMKAVPWLIASIILGSLLALGRVYSVLEVRLGLDEARSLSLQSGFFAAVSGFVALGVFVAIFRDRR